MKKILVLSVLFAALTASAQNKKPAAPAKKPVAQTTATKPLKTFMDSASYAIGVSMAKYYAQQGIKNISPAAVARAITDINSGKTPILNEYECNNLMMRFMDQVNKKQMADEKERMKQFQPVIDAGEKFLAENKNRPGVKTTASGLQYEVLREGTGPKPGPKDQVVAHYAGTLINGTEFDNSYKRGQPLTIPVDQVIAGWTEGLQLMPVGSKFKFYIPYQLGYGTRGAGNDIPPGAALIFEVELLEIKK